MIDLQKLITATFSAWYEMTACGTLKEAWELISREKFDLILLDVNLPDGSGFEFCARLKSDPATRDLPVILLSGKSDPIDKMMGFSVGADDYMTKPFERIEARARIEARLKKPDQARPSEEIFGPLRFDRVKLRAYNDQNGGEDLKLTGLEFKFLYFLSSNEGKVFSRQEIMKAIWEPNVHVSEESVYTHVCALRRKMGSLGQRIECIPRVGYRFLGKIKTAIAA